MRVLFRQGEVAAGGVKGREDVIGDETMKWRSVSDERNHLAPALRGGGRASRRRMFMRHVRSRVPSHRTENLVHLQV